ncbi:alpha/beta fold hydrolase [Actinoplanes sp. G11-F43]|uniref:alpha/beta fold hydrolase n=1 Tax=Actinoplanes sp. G11-F43 TaxID=3424130 RepID=UPI003D3411AA
METAVLPDGELHYREAGAGRPLVFLHGLLQDGRLWQPMIDRLGGRFHCVVPDLPLGAHRTALRPGADLSIKGVAKLVADFLETLGLHDVTLVGNDTGGAIAQLVAAHHPERLGQLVLTSCEAFDNVPPPVFRALAPAARMGLLPALLSPMRWRPFHALPSGFGWLTRGPIPHELTASWVAAYFADPAVRRDTAAFVTSLGHRRLLLDITGELAAFTRPTLVLWAADDRLFPVAHAGRLGRLFPNAQVTIVPDSRTWLMIDQPDRTATLLAEFAHRGPRQPAPHRP